MALGDQIRQLDEQVAAAVRRALDDVRDELRSGLEQAIGDLRDRLSEVSPELPDSFFTEDVLQQLTETAAPTGDAELAVAEARGRAAGSVDLREALAAIDRARSQKEILQALVDRSEPFASRAVVLLLRPEGLVGWTARGFDDSEKGVRSVSLPAQGDDWRDVIQEGPARPLTATRCGQLVSQLEGAVPTEGVAIPLVLRDRVAAVVYADRLAADAPFDVAALQVLVYTTALALETLAFREREATTTLLPGSRGAEPAEAPAPSGPEPEERVAELPREEPPAALPEEPTPELPEETESAPSVEVSPALEEEPAPQPPPLSDQVSGRAAGQATDEPEIEVEDASLEGAPALDDDLDQEFEVELEDYEETSFEEAPGPAAPQAGPGAGAETEAIPWRTEAPAPSEGADEPHEVEVEPERETTPLSDQEEKQAGAVAEPSEPASLEDRPEAGAVPPPAPAPEQPPAAGAEAPSEAPPETPSEAGATAGGEQGMPEPPPSGGPIEPPPDVEGPGLAFSSGKRAEAAESEDDGAAHDEARRLARLLVSEIQLYNQEEVSEGRSKGDIYERLKDDIDRSRQLYEERVDPGIRESTDYFYQELVRQLGAGDAKALGI